MTPETGRRSAGATLPLHHARARATDPRSSRGLPAWAATWLSILAASLAGAVALARLSAEGARNAVETALSDHLAAQAGLAAGALHEAPVELLVAMKGEESASALRAQVDGLAERGHLRGLALLGPAGEIVGHEGRWLPAGAERDFIARARQGDTVSGPLYGDQQGELYQTAYRPLDGHPGWVVAVEGSAATLGAVDELEQAQWKTGATVVLLTGILGAVLAALVSGPLRRLERELSHARPGAPPEVLGDQGFREVRQVAAAGRELLGAIRARDRELEAAHRREVAQLTRMAAEIAHEVGNPLNAVQLSVQRLGTVADPDKRARALDRVQGQLAELERIVDWLRDLTRPLRPEPVPVRLDALIDSVAAEVEGLTISVEGTPPPALHTDRGMLAQVLRNLLLNARQAGAQRATLRIEALPDGLLGLTLTDDGPGIAEGGSGPGVFLVPYDPGNGYRPGPAPLPPHRRSTGRQPRAGPPLPRHLPPRTAREGLPMTDNAQGPLIFVVDDHAASAEALAENLEDAGYAVRTFPGPEGVLAAVREDDVSVVITDLRMDGMDGIALLRECRRLDPSLPVILVTAHASIARAIEATQAGAFAFVTKPVHLPELLVQVRNAVALRTDLSGGRPRRRGGRAHRGTLGSTSGRPVPGRPGRRHRHDRADHRRERDGQGAVGPAPAPAVQAIRGPFVPVNCGAIPDSLVESELFGAARAPTPAPSATGSA